MNNERGYGLLTSNWWLRSPNVGNSNNVRNVNTDGSLNNNNANNSQGLVPDCINSQLRVRPIGPKSVHFCKEPLSCPLLSGEKRASMPLIQDMIEAGYPRRDFFSFDTDCRACIMGMVYGFDSLYHSMRKCSNGVRWKDSVAKFTNNGLLSTYRLRQDLLNGRYRVGPPMRFMIHEPKTREVTSTKYRDRVVDKSLNANYYAAAISNHFIYDNGACQKGKGTDFSRARLKAMMVDYAGRYGNDGYVLSLDVKSFFGSTKHDTAKLSVSNILGCPWAIYMVANIIDSYATKDSPDAGIGLGSEINQYTQLAVLSKIDHRIKEQLSCRHYQRYMDDMDIIHKDKEYLKYCRDEIGRMLDSIGLRLNQSKTQIHTLAEGVNYLGYKFRVTPTGKVLVTVLKSNVKKRKRKIRAHARLVAEGRMAIAAADTSFEAWLSHVEKGDNYRVVQNMIRYYDDIMGGTYGSFIERRRKSKARRAGKRKAQGRESSVAGSDHRARRHHGRSRW